MSIEANTSQTNNPTLIIVRGIPGGGKSYITTKLQDTLGTSSVVVLDPDAIDKASRDYITFSEDLTRDTVDQTLHPYRFLRAKAHQAISDNKIIIWNQGFIDPDGLRKTLINLQDHASKLGKQLPTLVVEVEIDADIARQRVAQRTAGGGHAISSKVLDRFIDQYRSFSGSGYKTVTVDGQADIINSIASIINALPEIR
jgi:tRNA uridine 5-carbamoylmethylation protein Kti12